ncbi:MAG TPA: GNAT family N-acetyltransferase [Ohtaekwangia sp.]
MTESKTTIEILDFQQHHQPWFEKFNRAWIEKYFWMEPIDVQVLQYPDEHILKKGGKILMASYLGEIAGTVALKYAEPGVYEFTKMAVDEKLRGQKIGWTLSEAAIQQARNLGAYKIILYSSTLLKNAIAMYRKLGFKEVPVDGPYKRSDIKMELMLDGTANPFDLRKANAGDLDDLLALSMKTFQDTFGEHNTTENMKLYMEKGFSRDRIKREFEAENSVFFLAFDHAKLVGYARVRKEKIPEGLSSSNALEIERIYSRKEYFGKGLGQKLLHACVHHARKSGYDTIWLGVWEHNPRAVAFYEKSGFKKFNEHTFVLGTDPQTDWLMKKSL